MKEIIALSDELINVVKKKIKGNKVDDNQCKMLFEKISKSIDNSKEKLAVEKNIVCDKEWETF